MSEEQKLIQQLEKAELEISYLKRRISRMEKRLLRQEKLDDMNRHQTRWAMQQLEQARMLAEQASKAKTDFLANMSHEIRTPLNIVLGMGELLAGTHLEESQKQYLQSLRLSGEHLLKLINDILEFSRIESGTIELITSPFDLKELLVGVEAMATHLAQEKAIGFFLDYDTSVDSTRLGDSRKIRQILINLVGNAVKYTDSGRVGLSVKRLAEDDAEKISFIVTDTGVGIPDNMQPLIFTRFTQIEQGSVQHKGGVGLGLAISKRLALAMGGQIHIDSEVNRGSTFTLELSLPLAEKAPYTSEGGGETGTADQVLPPLKLLVVDDIYLNFEVIKNYLKGMPVAVSYAEHGRQAQKAFLDHSPDIVLMDLRMPVMDGIEATAHIRRLETRLETVPTPIIAMTAHAFVEQENTYLEKGFDEVLIKPFSQQDVVRILKRYGPTQVVEIGQAKAAQTPEKSSETASEALAALVPKVLDSINKEIRVIKEALYENDRDKVIQASHAVKGLAGFYGFDRLSGLLEHLDDSVRQREFRTAYALAEALGSHVNELRRGRPRQNDDLAN